MGVQEISLRDLQPEKILGQGGFGKVILVKNMKYQPPLSRLSLQRLSLRSKKNANMPQYMALKILLQESLKAEGSEQIVDGERRTHGEAVNTGCPFILKLFGAFQDSKSFYFLLECCEKGDIYKLVQKRTPQLLSEAETKFYVACVSEGLRAIHSAGIVYRDIKPENILLADNAYPRIADFGLAKKIGTGKTLTVCGTPLYMAPEMILGKPHDFGVDWWSLGVLIFELTTGQAPFDGDSMMAVFGTILKFSGGDKAVNAKIPKHANISKEGRLVIGKLMEPTPSKRLNTKNPKDLQKSDWFKGLNWTALTAQSIIPPGMKSLYKPPEARFNSGGSDGPGRPMPPHRQNSPNPVYNKPPVPQTQIRPPPAGPMAPPFPGQHRVYPNDNRQQSGGSAASFGSQGSGFSNFQQGYGSQSPYGGQQGFGGQGFGGQGFMGSPTPPLPPPPGMFGGQQGYAAFPMPANNGSFSSASSASSFGANLQLWEQQIPDQGRYYDAGTARRPGKVYNFKNNQEYMSLINNVLGDAGFA